MLTDLQKQILDGAMLGDGSLILHRGAKNVYFQYLSSIKEHVEYLFQYFIGMCNYTQVKSGSYFDKRTNKTYTRYWFRTKMLPVLTEEYNRWYLNNKKIIPNDLILTPINCLIWYIGDGSLSKIRKGKTGQSGGSIQLSTDCFNVDDIKNILIPQMIKYGPKIYLSDDLPRVIIPRKNVEQYLNYLGNCPINCFQYKWDSIPYAYGGYKEGIKPLDDMTIQKILLDYSAGKSYYEIAKSLDLYPRRIQYYLKKYNVYVPNRDCLKVNLSDSEIDKIVEMRFNGSKWKDLEKLYNIRSVTLRKYIKMRKYNEK